MTFLLEELIREASTELGAEACRDGKHQWVSIGGRACPHPKEIGCGRCSQAVYECATCSDTDYGERGGPGWADCRDGCMQGGRGYFAAMERKAAQPAQDGKPAP